MRASVDFSKMSFIDKQSFKMGAPSNFGFHSPQNIGSPATFDNDLFGKSVDFSLISRRQDVPKFSSVKRDSNSVIAN